jgi:hypothetical protein
VCIPTGARVSVRVRSTLVGDEEAESNNNPGRLDATKDVGIDTAELFLSFDSSSLFSFLQGQAKILLLSLLVLFIYFGFWFSDLRSRLKRGSKKIFVKQIEDRTGLGRGTNIASN